MESKEKHNGSPTPWTHLHLTCSPLPPPPGTPPSHWTEAPLCVHLHPFLRLGRLPTPSLHPSPSSPLLCQTCRHSIRRPHPLSPPRHLSRPPCSRLPRSRLAVARRRHCAPPPGSSLLTHNLPDPAAPIPSPARWRSSSPARSPRTSASSVQPSHFTFRGPCLLLHSHSFPCLLRQQPQPHPPPRSKGPCPCSDRHRLSILLHYSLLPLNILLPPLCLWRHPPPFHLPSHLVASHLPQEGSKPSNGSLLTTIFQLQAKHRRSPSSLPVP